MNHAFLQNNFYVAQIYERLIRVNLFYYSAYSLIEGYMIIRQKGIL